MNRCHRPLLAAFLAALCLTCPALAQDFDGATYLALEFDGPSGIIRADPARVAAIDAELSLIREQYPLLSSIDVFPGFIPGSLIVSMTDEALSELEAGTFTGFDEIFEEYPVASIHIFTLLPAASIRFEEPLHSPNMLPLFLAVEGVTDAQANGAIGDGHDIILHDMGWYTFKYGWGDCPSGCMYEHYWEIQIQDGAAVVLQEWGDDMPVAAVE